MTKKVFLYASGTAVGKHGEALSEEQEILGNLADIAMDIFAMESALLRAKKSRESLGEEASKLKIDMTRLFINDAMAQIAERAKRVFCALQTGDALAEQLALIQRLLGYSPIDSIAVRRNIADRIIEAERYLC